METVIQAKLNPLTKWKGFGPVVQIPEDVKPVGYKQVFVWKRNENNEIIRYKVRLVAQGFSQKPGIDYEETFSPIMDAITYHFLISLVISCVSWMLLQYIYMDPWIMIYTWKSLNDLSCLKQIVQSLVACTQSSYNDSCMD